METILPGVIVDGAHNEDGVRRSLWRQQNVFRKSILLLCCFLLWMTKIIQDMIHTILDRIHFRHVVVTQVGGYRKVPAEDLAEIFRRYGCSSAEACEDVTEAFRKALSDKGRRGNAVLCRITVSGR